MTNRFPNNTFLVYYDNFTENPQESGKAIFKFIGEQFTENVLEKPTTIKDSNSWDVLLDCKVQVNKYDPKRYLTEEEIDLVTKSFGV